MQIFIFAPSGKQPGLLDAPPVFKGLDQFSMAQGQTDIVPTVEQAFLSESIDGKRQGPAIGANDLLPLEIDQQPITRRRPDQRKQRIDLGGRQDDRQDTVLEAVVEEDVGETLGEMARKPKSSKAQGACSRELSRSRSSCAPGESARPDSAAG
jgi:hypothetical protein